MRPWCRDSAGQQDGPGTRFKQTQVQPDFKTCEPPLGANQNVSDGQTFQVLGALDLFTRAADRSTRSRAAVGQ